MQFQVAVKPLKQCAIQLNRMFDLQFTFRTQQVSSGEVVFETKNVSETLVFVLNSYVMEYLVNIVKWCHKLMHSKHISYVNIFMRENLIGKT